MAVPPLADTSTAGSGGTVDAGGAAVVVGAGTEVVVDRAGAAGCRSGKLVCEATGAGAGVVELDAEGHARHRYRDRRYRQGPQDRRPLGTDLFARPGLRFLARRLGADSNERGGGRARRRGRPAPSLRERSRRVAGDNVLEVKDLGLDDGHGPGRGAITGAHRRHPGQGGVFAVPVPTLAWWRGRAAPPNPGESTGRDHR